MPGPPWTTTSGSPWPTVSWAMPICVVLIAGPPLWWRRSAGTVALEPRFKSRLRVEPELTIGEVARRAGVATSQIRYYERIGMLPPPERLSGQRRYAPDVLGRLTFIGVAQSAGFKLREIKALMA